MEVPKFLVEGLLLDHIDMPFKGHRLLVGAKSK